MNTTGNQSRGSGISLDLSWANLSKYDGPAGLVVFLVALPLCLGIALASGAPLFSGIIAGAIGGIVIGWLSGSHISVSGPAAGLTVIVFSAIQHVGSFRAFLVSVVLAGGMQLALGFMGAGVIGDYVPNGVIKGMLAAIGLVIILKQIPHALGRDKDFEGDFSFFEASGSNTFTDVVASVMTASTGAVVISILSLLVLVFWEQMSTRGIKLFTMVPGPLVVVVLGITLNNAFGIFFPAWKLTDPDHMVQLPVASSFSQFLGQFESPDFSVVANPAIWQIAVTIALVASLETLLSLEAADRLDPFRRISSPNRELRAQGIGNVCSGLLGGLPVTSVVVRTTANVYSGARTRMSVVVHGVLLALSVGLIPHFLNWTPLASLAAVLITVGYKLTKPKLYINMFRLGWDQFLPFAFTVLAIVFTDLLKGVILGLIAGVFFVIRSNHRDAVTMVQRDGWYLLRLNKDATFVNKSELRAKLRSIPENAHVIVDGTKALYVDQDIVEVLQDYQRSAPFQKITVELKNIELHRG